jgi:hypothetical protein
MDLALFKEKFKASMSRTALVEYLDLAPQPQKGSVENLHNRIRLGLTMFCAETHRDPFVFHEYFSVSSFRITIHMKNTEFFWRDNRLFLVSHELKQPVHFSLARFQPDCFSQHQPPFSLLDLLCQND